MLPGGLGEMVAEGFVELGPDALGGDDWCDPHAVTPTHAIRLMAISRIVFGMKVFSPGMFELCSGLVDLVVCVVRHGSGGHVCTCLRE
jgi:hypothetical protein